MVAAGYIVIALFSAYGNYASTPQQAVISALNYPHRPHVRVVRTNLVDHYATVLTRGAAMEGSWALEGVLVERFSFGWQPLDEYSRCNLDRHGIPATKERLLMVGMPKPQDDGPCTGVEQDSGPTEDVEAVREQMHGPFVPYVRIVGKYALGNNLFSEGGGESLFRRDAGGWHEIAGGGGALGLDDMRQYGVPQRVWCALGIYGAKCNGRS